MNDFPAISRHKSISLTRSSASGLGRATALELYHAGGNIAILDFNSEAGKSLISTLSSDRAAFFETDVTSTSSIGAAITSTIAWTRTTAFPLGGVIAAAGISLPAKILGRNNEPFDLDDFDFVLAVNLRGTIDLIRQCLPHLSAVAPVGADGERGVIIMVASSAAFDGQTGQVAYSASKGAIAALTLPLTRDVARYGIRVVTIAPSLFESNMTAGMSEKVRKSLESVMEFPRRAGRGEEFAGLVRQGVENVMLNGVVLRLDGGMRMPSKM